MRTGATAPVGSRGVVRGWSFPQPAAASMSITMATAIEITRMVTRAGWHDAPWVRFDRGLVTRGQSTPPVSRYRSRSSSLMPGNVVTTHGRTPTPQMTAETRLVKIGERTFKRRSPSHSEVSVGAVCVNGIR
jgi:hypothetical protein